jgi:hypothetical protein
VGCHGGSRIPEAEYRRIDGKEYEMKLGIRAKLFGSYGKARAA